MKNFMILCTILLVASCSNDADDQAADGSDPKAAVEDTARADQMAARISSLEDSVSHHLAVDRRSAQALVDVYKGYAAAFPLDRRSPEYLFRASNVYLTMREPEKSLNLYDRIIVDYPSWEDLPNVYFMRGFVLDDRLDQKGEAQKAYQKVIYTYPEHPLAEQARAAIENLQYTRTELMQRFQGMESEQTDPATAR